MQFNIGGTVVKDKDAKKSQILKLLRNIPDGDLHRTRDMQNLLKIARCDRLALQNDPEIRKHWVKTYLLNDSCQGVHATLWGNAKTVRQWRKENPEWIRD